MTLVEKLSVRAANESDVTTAADALDIKLSNGEQLDRGIAVGAREPDIRRTVECLSGRAKDFPRFNPQTFGKLIAEHETTGAIAPLFIWRRSWRKYHADQPLTGLTVRHESRLLSEAPLISDGEAKPERLLVLRLPRSQRAITKKVAKKFKPRSASAPRRR